MGDVVRLNRAARRARFAVRKREERLEQKHCCAVTTDAARQGVFRRPIRISPAFYHDVHQALGERTCPMCLKCLELKGQQRIAPALKAELREVVLASWHLHLARELQSAP